MPNKTTGAHARAGKNDADLLRPELYINREISTVDFTRRVLEEASAKRHPLLDRVRFLSFAGNQLDEFLVVRVAGLKDQMLAQVTEVGPDGLSPSQQLEALRPRIFDLYRQQWRILRDELLPALADAGIAVLDYDQLTRTQKEVAEHYFHESVLPVLTPLGVDPGKPFPHISSRSLNLAMMLRDPVLGEVFARLKLPATLRRFVPVPSGRERARLNGHAHEHGGRGPLAPQSFVWLEQLIAANWAVVSRCRDHHGASIPCAARRRFRGPDR